MGIQKLRWHGYSTLVIQQINREFNLKESALVSYRVSVQRLVKFSRALKYEHVPRSPNKHDNASATLASMVDVRDKVVGVKVIRKALQATMKDFIPIQSIVWRALILR